MAWYMSNDSCAHNGAALHLALKYENIIRNLNSPFIYCSELVANTCRGGADQNGMEEIREISLCSEGKSRTFT
jgi:hypothetical protein